MRVWETETIASALRNVGLAGRVVECRLQGGLREKIEVHRLRGVRRLRHVLALGDRGRDEFTQEVLGFFQRFVARCAVRRAPAEIGERDDVAPVFVAFNLRRIVVGGWHICCDPWDELPLGQVSALPLPSHRDFDRSRTRSGGVEKARPRGARHLRSSALRAALVDMTRVEVRGAGVIGAAGGPSRRRAHGHGHPFAQPTQCPVNRRGLAAVFRVQHAPQFALGDAEVAGEAAL